MALTAHRDDTGASDASRGDGVTARRPQVGRAVATFWHGPKLPRLDLACLLSFVQAGFDVTVYSYRDLPELPAALTRGDAREIADETFLTRFRIEGRPSTSHFTDYFRYRLFQQTDAAWVDTDILCLSAFTIPSDRHFLTRETDRSLNGAISRLTRGDGVLDRLVAQTVALADTPLAWGATGPALITRVMGLTDLHEATPPARFYPFHWLDWWKPFLPSERDACAAATTSSDAVHLWNNVIERTGYWKDLAPPEGSFLHEAFRSRGLLDLFRDTLPLAVMQRIVENDLNLRLGDHMTLKRLGRIVARRLLRNAGL